MDLSRETSGYTILRGIRCLWQDYPSPHVWCLSPCLQLIFIFFNSTWTFLSIPKQTCDHFCFRFFYWHLYYIYCSIGFQLLNYIYRPKCNCDIIFYFWFWFTFWHKAPLYIGKHNFTILIFIDYLELFIMCFIFYIWLNVFIWP